MATEQPPPAEGDGGVDGRDDDHDGSDRLRRDPAGHLATGGPALLAARRRSIDEAAFGTVRRNLRPSQPAAITGIFLVVALAALHEARAFFLPVVLALLLDFLLSPLVRGLGRLRVPAALGSALVLLLLMGGVGTAGYLLAEPANAWMQRAPLTFDRLESKLHRLRRPVERVSQAAEEVEKIARVDGGTETPEVQIRQDGVGARWLANTQTLLFDGVVVVVLLYFLLATGDLFLRRLMQLVFQLRDERRAVDLVRQMEQQASRYLITVTAINTVLGLAVAAAMLALGMPNPLLWGVVAMLLNFVPYLGALTGVVILSVVSFLSFDHLATAILPPLVYFSLTALEGNFVTPAILGRRFALSPVVIFLWLLFWGWMWGIPGALLAVPMLTLLKIVSDHVPALQPVADFLAR